MKNKTIKITCYGQTQEFKTKQQAIDYFMDGVYSCDPQSSEAGRYMYIIQKIMNNETTITDREY